MGILLFSCSFEIKMSSQYTWEEFFEKCLTYNWDFEDQMIELLGQEKANMVLYLAGSTINCYSPVHQITSMWNDLNKIVDNKFYTDKIFEIAEELVNKRQEELVPILLGMDDFCFSVNNLCNINFFECHKYILQKLSNKKFRIMFYNGFSQSMLSKSADHANMYVFCEVFVGEECLFTINVNSSIIELLYSVNKR